MSDPLTILGAAASITTLIEVLSKTVIALHALHTRYASADFTFLNLIAQLTALKAALSRLQEWMNTEIDEVHHQLVMDLEVSVSCCRMLARRIGDEVEGLGADENKEGGLDMKAKLKLIVKNGSLEELQRMVDRQTGSLGLLLTVCNCKAISDQKILLEKASTRKVFMRVRDDTSSLYVQRDSSSLYSRCTDNLSKISKTFEFDRELFLSKVYEKAIRGTMRETLDNMRRKKLQVDVGTSEERKQNQRLELKIEKDSQILRSTATVLVLGDTDSARKFMKNVKFPDRFSHEQRREEREEQRVLVMKNVLHVMQTIVRIVNDGNFVLDHRAEVHVIVLQQGIISLQAGGSVPPGSANALQWLWEDEKYRTEVQKSEVNTPTSLTYFVGEIQRIAQPDYVPIEADLRELDPLILAKDGIQEHKLQLRGLCLRIADATMRSGIGKWISQFENTTSIIFFVDLSQYDEHSFESGINRMTEQVLLFESVVNSGYFLHSSIILFLCNMAVFRDKLAIHPLSTYFTDYDRGPDVNMAAKYLLWRFNQVNRAHLQLYPLLCEAADVSNLGLVSTAVKETILHNVRF